MDERAIRAKIQAIDKTLSDLSEELERGFIEFGRYSRLKTEWEQQKAALEAQLSDVTAPQENAVSGASPRAGRFNTAAIRDLLAAAFSDEELTTLCFDHFPSVYEEFSSGMSKPQKIHHLVEHCQRHLLFDQLLALVREHNPAQFAHFEAQLRAG
jgi:hypothetical protein